MMQYAVQAISAIGSGNLTSAVIDARHYYRIAGQVIVGAGANTAGTLQLQYSCDPMLSSGVGGSGVTISGKGTINGVVNWNNFGTAVTVAGAAASVSILFSSVPFSDIGYAWIRAVYTDTSGGTGLGLITVNLNFQGV
jgi:hypothetical protein